MWVCPATCSVPRGRYASGRAARADSARQEDDCQADDKISRIEYFHVASLC